MNCPCNLEVGRIPGETRLCRAGETVCVKARIFSPWGLSHLQAVCNGRVVARRELSGHNEAEVELPDIHGRTAD